MVIEIGVVLSFPTKETAADGPCVRHDPAGSARALLLLQRQRHRGGRARRRGGSAGTENQRARIQLHATVEDAGAAEKQRTGARFDEACQTAAATHHVLDGAADDQIDRRQTGGGDGAVQSAQLPGRGAGDGRRAAIIVVHRRDGIGRAAEHKVGAGDVGRGLRAAGAVEGQAGEDIVGAHQGQHAGVSRIERPAKAIAQIAEN